MLHKKNFPLLIGFALPFVLIVGIILSIYLPQFFVTSRPKYNFVYTVPSYAAPASSGSYSVKDGKITLSCFDDQPKVLQTYPPITVPASPCTNTANNQLYLYDTTNFSSRVLTYEEAKQLTITPFNESPDGYQVVRGGSSDGLFGFLGGSSNYNEWYLEGHHLIKKINTPTAPQSYYDLQLLGWVAQ